MTNTSSRHPSNQPHPIQSSTRDRKARLASALRTNLAKRRQQMHARRDQHADTPENSSFPLKTHS